MSLINDMLRDLETRRSDELQRQNLQGEIRPLPMPRRETRGWLVAVVAGGAALSLAGIVWLTAQRDKTSPGVPEAAPLSQTPAPTGLRHAISEPVRTPSGEAEFTLRPATALASSPGAATPEQAVSAPAATIVAPPSATPTKPEILSSRSAAAPKASTPVVPTAVPPDTAPVKAAAAVPTGSIELKPAPSSPRERAEAEYRSGGHLLNSGRSSEAIESLRAALRHDAAFALARQALVRALLDGKRPDDAIAVLNEGLETSPGQLAWAMSLARLQVDRNDLAAAQRTLARSAPYAGASADFAGFHGHIFHRLGQHRDALIQYQLATRLAAGEGKWWFGLAMALDAEGRPAEARDAYRRALACGNLNADLTHLAEQKLR